MNNWSKFKEPMILITPMYDYWIGGMILIPQSLKLLPNKIYKSKRILSWYEKQKINHDQVMDEFKRIFSWQKN
jgi:hypothetical protein